jgi:hypothetical protein
MYTLSSRRVRFGAFEQGLYFGRDRTGVMNNLHGDPRYTALLKKLNLPT